MGNSHGTKPTSQANLFFKREQARRHSFEKIWRENLNAVFDDAARYYEPANNVASFGLWKHLRRRFVAAIEVTPGMAVLDVCAGANAIGFALLEKQAELQVFALDRSPAMQQSGRDLAIQQGLIISGVIGDAHNLPYADDTFDLVTMQYASRHLNVMESIAEIKRVLKPGGHFYHCDMMRPSNKIFAWGYYLFLRLSLFLTSILFRSSPLAKRHRSYFIETLRMFYTVGEYTELLRQSGFINVLATPMFCGALGHHHAMKPKQPHAES